MAHFAIVCPEDAGHVLSLGPIGRELIQRGHRVTLMGRARAAPLAEQLGLPLHELKSDDIPEVTSRVLDLVAEVCAGELIGMRDWFRWQAESVLQLVPPAIKELGIDGLIVDHVVAGGGTAAERAGIPFVTICSAVLWHKEAAVPPSYTRWAYRENSLARLRNRIGYTGWRWFTWPTLAIVNRYRKLWKLRPFHNIDETYSPLAQISQMCPGFDFPRRDLPGHFHYIGSLTTDRRDKDQTFPWDRLDGRPLVFASLGTVPDPANGRVFKKILNSCNGLDAQLVLALGKWNDEGDMLREALGPIPDNALVVDFAPQLALLDRAAALVTHAGVNTVLESLCRGVPIVALPRSADQPAMGSRVAHAGAGLLGSFRRSSSREVKMLVERVLHEETFRRQAQQLQGAMRAAGGLVRAADLVEEALISGRPVLRD